MIPKERIAKGLYWSQAWNLIQGCSPASKGCKNCWAAAEAAMRSKHPNEKIKERYAGLTGDGGQWNGTVRCNTEALQVPSRERKPQVFSLWTDLFHEAVPVAFIARAWDMMRENQQHRFLVLTKRASRMHEVLGRIGNALPNVGLGVTVEGMSSLARVAWLRDTPAAMRYLSCEPLLEEIRFVGHPGVDWIIAGGESGPGARRMDARWIYGLEHQARSWDIPLWFKQWGEYCELGPRVGKHRAGRLLSGVEVLERPTGFFE